MYKLQELYEIQKKTDSPWPTKNLSQIHNRKQYKLLLICDLYYLTSDSFSFMINSLLLLEV